MGGRGARTGRGAMETLSSVAYFPAYVTRSRVHSRRMISRASSVRGPRSAGGTPQASNSAGFSPPTPTPSTNRPPLTLSSAAPSFAASTAGYSGSRVTEVISSIADVAAAAAARLMNAFAIGMLKLTCSPVVRKSQPWASIRRQASPMPSSITESRTPNCTGTPR